MFLWMYLLMPQHSKVPYYVCLLCIQLSIKYCCSKSDWVLKFVSKLSQMLKKICAFQQVFLFKLSPLQWGRWTCFSNILRIIADVEEDALVQHFSQNFRRSWRSCACFNIFPILSQMFNNLHGFQNFYRNCRRCCHVFQNLFSRIGCRRCWIRCLCFNIFPKFSQMFKYFRVFQFPKFSQILKKTNAFNISEIVSFFILTASSNRTPAVSAPSIETA